MFDVRSRGVDAAPALAGAARWERIRSSGMWQGLGGYDKHAGSLDVRPSASRTSGYVRAKSARPTSARRCGSRTEQRLAVAAADIYLYWETGRRRVCARVSVP